jgi:osmotically-inducible protein OsmY
MPFWRALKTITRVLRPTPTTDEAIHKRVRQKLERSTKHGPSISVAVEHGCVELRGPIETEERGRVVQEIARVKGVDAVVDLMTEPERVPLW